MTSFNKYKEDYIRFRAVINLAAKKEESSDKDSSYKDDKPAPKEVAEKKGSKLNHDKKQSLASILISWVLFSVYVGF